jgi:tRNA(Ile)-lysidine synthase
VREKVLRNIRERAMMSAGDRVGVAVSGGADSVALLRVLLELRSEFGIVLAVAHFNHGLRGEQSAADEAFVADLAKQHGLEFFVDRDDVREHALAGKLSLEAAGRAARYQWFAHMAEQQRLSQIATAHTLDDQAETVLLKFLRGAGTRGLAGIYPIVNRSRFRIVRPLLPVTRAEVEGYLSSLGQVWREDESNLDHRFLRNRIRHELLPLLEREYNPRLRHLLADLAKLSQGEQHYWDELVAQHLILNDAGELLLAGFTELPVALQRRVVKRFAEADGHALDFAHVEKLRRCALGELRKVELPGDRLAMRANSTLQIRSLRSATEVD